MILSDEKFIFYLDIDGTLYCNGIICEANRRAVRKVRENGHLVFINSGRSFGVMPEVVAEFAETEVDGLITSLGSNIKIGDSLYYSKLIPTDELAGIFVRFETEGRGVMYEGNDAVIVSRNFGKTGYKAYTVGTEKEFREIAQGRPIPKVFVPGVLSEADKEYYSEHYMFCQHPEYAEISPKGDNKATGMDKVAEYYAPDKYTSVAMGDSLNDIEMLEHADISVGMGDSHEKIIPLCDIITCNGADGGVAQAMYKITGLKEN